MAGSANGSQQAAGGGLWSRVDGSAQQAILARYHDIVDDLTTLGLAGAPSLAATSSAFGFVLDPGEGRDCADTSAVAQHLDVLVRAVAEIPLASGRQPGDETDPDRRSARLVVQGCRALANGWYQEAEKLFLAAADASPTDALTWFGAGLAASNRNRSQAAEHFSRAARYLLVGDQPGAVYVSIMAAGLHERSGDRRQARQVLSDTLSQLDVACPALSLHLARLGPDRRSRLEEALAVDPMLEADLVALGLEVGPDAVAVRRARTVAEIGQVEVAIAELRRVDGGPSRPDPPRDDPAGGSAGRLPLVAAEMALAAKAANCRAALAAAATVVAEREQLRRRREAAWSRQVEVAGSDLVHRTTVPVFCGCAALAVALVIVALSGHLLVRAWPGGRLVVAGVLWLVVAALLVGTGWLVVTAWWPRRRYQRARLAKTALPQLRVEVSQRRDEEFEARRRYNRARHDAERKLARLAEGRKALRPCRPRFAGRPAAGSSEGPAGDHGEPLTVE